MKHRYVRAKVNRRNGYSTWWKRYGNGPERWPIRERPLRGAALKRFISQESGAETVEAALIVACVLGMVAVLVALGIWVKRRLMSLPG